MDIITSLFPCISPRKSFKQHQEQETICPTEQENDHQAEVSDSTPADALKILSYRQSIRLVESDSDSTICLEDEDEGALPTIRVHETEDEWNERNKPHVEIISVDADSPDPKTHLKKAMKRRKKERRKHECYPPRSKLPDPKARIIEDIPEEESDEDDDNDDDNDGEELILNDLYMRPLPPTPEPEHDMSAPGTDVFLDLTTNNQSNPSIEPTKRHSIWRENARSSLIEIFEFLRSPTSRNSLQLSGLKWPSPPKSRPSTAVFSSSTTSFSSAATATEQYNADIEKHIPRKDRRMGAAIFPTLRLGGKKYPEDDNNATITAVTGKNALFG